MYSSFLIQLILRFFSRKQSIPSIVSYLIDLKTSNINFCKFFSIITSI